MECANDSHHLRNNEIDEIYMSSYIYIEGFMRNTFIEKSGAIYPSIKNKCVIVSGGGSGIGAAIVESFARQGAKVAFLDIIQDESQALVRRLADSVEHKPIFQKCDLVKLAELEVAVNNLEDRLGGIDILINNAANDDRHTVEEVTPEYWDNRMAVNLRHLFFASQAVVPAMRRNGGGVILNLGSISWHLALPDIVLYQTAKAAIEGMSRAMARDLGGYNIRVNTVIPGAVRTSRQDELWHDDDEVARILAGQCLKDRVMPADIAAMLLFLSSDDARMCTAHNYFIDAGWR